MDFWVSLNFRIIKRIKFGINIFNKLNIFMKDFQNKHLYVSLSLSLYIYIYIYI